MGDGRVGAKLSFGDKGITKTGNEEEEINSAFVNDLDIVAVGIEHPCCVIARVVFGSGLRWFLALASGVQSRLVECIHLRVVFRYKSNMDGLGIGLAFFEPEKGFFAVAEAF